MNTISSITATLLNCFNSTPFPDNAPPALCIWQDSRQQWRAGARRLATFPLQMFNRNAPEHLHFDDAKHIYFPRSVCLNELPAQIYGAVANAFPELCSKSRRARIVVYEKSQKQDALIAFEQAAQVIARAHETLRRAGQEPPAICMLPTAAKQKQREAAASRFPQWLTSLPDVAKEALFKNTTPPQSKRESTFSAMLDAYASAAGKAAPSSFTTAINAIAPKRPPAPVRPRKALDFGCAPTQPLPLDFGYEPTQAMSLDFGYEPTQAMSL